MLGVFFNQKQGDGENVTHIQSWCAACQRIESRIRQGMKNRGEPYGQRKPSKLGLRTSKKGYIAETPEEKEVFREYQRERYRNMTPAQRERRRETGRFLAEKKRRQLGMKMRRKAIDNRRIPGGRERVSIEPLQEWIEKRIVFYGGDLKRMSTHCDIDDAVMRRIRTGKYGASISVSVVDRILVAEGSTLLSEVYPDLY